MSHLRERSVGSNRTQYAVWRQVEVVVRVTGLDSRFSLASCGLEMGT